MKARFLAAAVMSAVGLLAPSAVGAPGAYNRPGLIERMSVTPTGAQTVNWTPACDFTGSGDVSSDGRYVVFVSGAPNLVATAGVVPASGGRCQIYWRDRTAHVTKLVSVGLSGEPALGDSGSPTISADGRIVSFASVAPNLVPGDTNGAYDVFVRDMAKNSTVRASVGSGEKQSNEPVRIYDSLRPSLSANGRYVAFGSDADNLVSGDTNTQADIFVRDLAARRTARVSLGPGGLQADGGSFYPSMSADGRFVVFQSNAKNLTPEQGTRTLVVSSSFQVFRFDRKSGVTQMVSLSTGGEPASGITSRTDVYGYSTFHNISNDGRFVVFSSNAPNLVPNDSNAVPQVSGNSDGTDVFVRDMVARRTERVSVDSSGRQQDGDGYWPSISGDGRFVVYTHGMAGSSCGTGLSLPVGEIATGVFPCGREVFVYDRLAGSVEVVSRPLNGSAAQSGVCGSITPTTGKYAVPSGLSRDGRVSMFLSSDPGLVPGDTNGQCDTFVRDRGAALGTGALTGTQPSTVPAGCGLPVCPPLPTAADLRQVRVLPRAGLKDLFVRWDVSRLASVSGVPSGGPLFGLRFTVGGQRYEVRAERIAGLDFDSVGGASFGLFRCDAPTGACLTKVATLKGGYGTVAEAVVAAVPLSALGLTSGGQLSDVTAYTAVGNYLSGPTKVLDSLRLSR